MSNQVKRKGGAFQGVKLTAIQNGARAVSHVRNSSLGVPANSKSNLGGNVAQTLIQDASYTANSQKRQNFYEF